MVNSTIDMTIASCEDKRMLLRMEAALAAAEQQKKLDRLANELKREADHQTMVMRLAGQSESVENQYKAEAARLTVGNLESFSKSFDSNRSTSDDEMSFVSCKTISTAQVSVNPCGHAEIRLQERRVSFEEVQQAKKHGQVSLHIVCVGSMDEKAAIESAKRWSSLLGGGAVQFNALGQPPRAEVKLMTTSLSAMEIKRRLIGAGYFQSASNRIVYSHSDQDSASSAALRVVEGKKSAQSDESVGVITVVRINKLGRPAELTPRSDPTLFGRLLATEGPEMAAHHELLRQEAQTKLAALGRTISARWYEDRRLYNGTVTAVTEDGQLLVAFDGYEDAPPQKTLLADVFEAKQDMRHRIQSRSIVIPQLYHGVFREHGDERVATVLRKASFTTSSVRRYNHH